MKLKDLTKRDAVEAAIGEFERLGRDRFLARYGFEKARSYFLIQGGKRYDSKAIAAAAVGLQYPDSGALSANDFSGGEATVKRRLEALGFTVIHDRGQDPDWTRDELILALDLYVQAGLLGDTDPRVIALSTVLNSLPIHPLETRTAKFRNPSGIARKLSNLANHDPNYTGRPTRGGLLDGIIYREWASMPDHLAAVANAIRVGVLLLDSQLAGDDESIDVDEEFPEGRVLTRLHRTRERSSALREKAKAAALRTGMGLMCAACGFDFAKTYGLVGEGYIECHHTVPLSELASGAKTQLRDVVLVCANCHRMIHRRRPWLAISDLRRLIS